MCPVLIWPSHQLRKKYQAANLFRQASTAIRLALLMAVVAAGEAKHLPGWFIAVPVGLSHLSGMGTWRLVDACFRSIRHENHEDVVIVAVGIWTHTIRHVPFRTVTSISVKGDLFDRLVFGIGTLEIQTAGAGTGTSGAEESLPGLVDYAGLYEVVAGALRRFRTRPLAPDQAGIEPPLDEPSALVDLLTGVRAIRRQLAEA